MCFHHLQDVGFCRTSLLPVFTLLFNYTNLSSLFFTTNKNIYLTGRRKGAETIKELKGILKICHIQLILFDVDCSTECIVIVFLLIIFLYFFFLRKVFKVLWKFTDLSNRRQKKQHEQTRFTEVNHLVLSPNTGGCCC